MRFSSIFAATASLVAVTQARVSGVGIPSTIKPGDDFDLIILTENYIQRVTDVAIAIGYEEGSQPLGGGSLGIFFNSYGLGKPILLTILLLDLRFFSPSGANLGRPPLNSRQLQLGHELHQDSHIPVRRVYGSRYIHRRLDEPVRRPV